MNRVIQFSEFGLIFGEHLEHNSLLQKRVQESEFPSTRELNGSGRTNALTAVRFYAILNEPVWA